MAISIAASGAGEAVKMIPVPAVATAEIILLYSF